VSDAIVDHRSYAVPRVSPPPGLKASELERELRERVRGEVLFDAKARALYATDGSNYRQIPIGVVRPLDEEDVIAAVDACRRHGAPLLSRGGGTSLAGQCCNVAVVLDFSRHMNRLLSLDPASRTAWVQPGIVLDDLRRAAEEHHLTFGPDPSTHDRCTLGGMIGNNSCGVHAQMAGTTAMNVEELDVLLYDGTRLTLKEMSEAELDAAAAQGGRAGEVFARLKRLRDENADEIRRRYPDIVRRVSGYNLPELLPGRFHAARALVGSEGTCVVVLRAKLRLVPSPPVRALLVLGYPSIYAAGDAVPDIDRYHPIGLEAVDDRLVREMKAKDLHPDYLEFLPPGNGWLLVEFGGDSKDEADAKAKRLMEHLREADPRPSTKLFADPATQRDLWIIRESGLGADARGPARPDTWEGWEDSAVPPAVLGDYLRDLHKLFETHGYEGSLYGHFGQGCVHTRITFDLVTAEGVRNFRSFLHDAAHLVVRHGGSISGEHGDGQSKAELLPIMFGERLVAAFREFKAIFDPDNKMNPGKVVDAHTPVENLRLGPEYRPWSPPTRFSFLHDEGDFSRAALRCVGVGSCRRESGGVMCPSYQVTREEQHSTRGRAHLLFEMMQGDVIRDGWRSREVREALDLCLACKGCKRDCPVGVDMATYKAEFLSHYYEGRLRPRNMYAIGLIDKWARLAALAPSAANAMAPVVKRFAGVHPRRQMPRFAPRTFRAGFRSLGEGPRVILWADTFNDHFHPETAQAAAEVLAAAGYRVEIPARRLCCGRPLYDYGMLDAARRYLRRILRTLRDDIAAGTPVVGIEPSCVAVFRDEMTDLLPNDQDAKRLQRQTFLLSEFLVRQDWRPPRLEGATAIVQGHCHHRSVLDFHAEEEVLARAGVRAEVLDSGCCGMAGGFGFERDHYEVSMAAAERVLLPRVRQAAPGTLVLADGFSCRTQVEQATGRRPTHLAELLQGSLRGGASRAPAAGAHEEETQPKRPGR
jgi:FAD/FMN-containing dehydrogenase/Fe-S oxidoreductase